MADREIRYLFRKKETSGSTLPSNSMIAEPFVNTFEGRMFFSGTPGGTYVPICGQTSVFEVGANVDYSNIASGLTTPYVDFRTGLTNPSMMAGRTFYDQSANTLSYYPYTPNMDIELNIGQEELVYVYNDSGSIIYKGQPCHINGHEISANTPTIILANASNLATYDIAGIASHDIQNQNYGFITKLGIIEGLTITGASPGDEIYLSDVNDGEFIHSTSDLQLMSRTTKIGVVITTGTTTSKVLVDIENEYPHLFGVKAANIIETGLLSTGVAVFGGLSANTIDNSKFDVGIVKGFVTDNITDPTNPSIRFINYTGSTGDSPSGITLTYLATHPVTYIGITGNTTNDIVQSTNPFTAQQYRDIIKLGVVVHSNYTSVVTTNIQPLINNVPSAQLYDLVMNLGKFNVNLGVGSNGNVYSANGANLSIDKTYGEIFSPGSNFLIDPKNPHVKETTSGASITFRYRLQNSTEYSNTTNIDPNNYDVGGVLTAVPINKYTVQRIALFESNITMIQYGQQLYDTMDEAWANIPFSAFNVEPNIAENGLIRAFLVIKEGTTDLTNIEQAKFVQANRWGCVKDTTIGDTHYNDIVNLKSTGLIEFGGLTKNAVSGYTFDVGAAKGWIVDNTTNASSPTLRYVNYDGDSGLTLTYLTGYPVTYIGITGNTSSDIVQSTTPFTTSQLRDVVRLGVVVHSDHTPPNNIVTTNNQPVLDLSPVSQIYDIVGGLGKFNVPNGVPGNIYSFNGANLKLNRTSGKIFSLGSNYLIDKKNPHIKSILSGSSITFRYRLQNSTEYADTTDVDPNNYDLNGVLTTVPLNKFTVQRLSLFESGINRFQYGQNLYDSIDDAEASIPTEPFVVEPNIAGNGITRAFLIVKQGTTELNDIKLAKIVIAGRWGLANETVPGNVHRTQILNDSSTGLRNGGLITTASTTTFNVSSGTGVIINNSDANNPIFQEIIWEDQTGITISNITGEVATYIAINNSGTTVQYPFSSPPSQSDKRNNIFLGFIAHSNKTSITNVYNYPIHFVSPVNQHEDLTTSIGPFSINGNQVSAITGTFELQKTAGHSYMYGSDFQADATNPSILTCAQVSGSSTPQYRLVYAKGSEIIGLSGYTVDYLNYNPGGGSTITPVSNHYFVTHRVWHLPITNLLVWQYGQYQYSTLGDAINNLNTENYVSSPGLAAIGYLLAVFIVGEDATSLTQTSQNRVIYQNKFAGTGGGGGAIADTLQTAYNNSSQPEILTDSTRGAVTFQNGAGADSLNLIEGKDSGGVITSFIRGDGYISGSTFNGGILLSAGTNLYDIFLTTNDGNDITRVQPGLNTYTGGTANNPTVNVSAATLNSLSVSGASSFGVVSATTMISGSTNLNSIFTSVNDDRLDFPVDVNRFGFTNHSDTEIIFDGIDTFTLSATSTDWSYYRIGVKYTITGNSSIQVASPMMNNTLYYIYIDSTGGTLSSSTSAWTLDPDSTKVPVSTLYWLTRTTSQPTGTTTLNYVLTDERHTCLIDRQIHRYEHLGEGTKFLSGAILSGYTLNSAVASDKVFSISETKIADEDIFITLTPKTKPDGTTPSYYVWYRTNTSTWSWIYSDMPFKYSQLSPTTYRYIEYDNGSGVSTQTPTNRFVNTYLVLTNSIRTGDTLDNSTGDFRFVIVQGRGSYNTAELAYGESFGSFDLNGFPVAEAVAVYQLTWEAKSSYSNTTKGRCALNRVSSIVSNIVTTSVSATLAHNSLVGLQGGQAGQYYHLTDGEHTNLTSGNFTASTIYTGQLSASTLYSGSTNLYDIFDVKGSEDVTRVQPGLNTYTGGTPNNPSINISSATLSHLVVSGNTLLQTISATTICSGSTDLYNIFALIGPSPTGASINFSAITNTPTTLSGYGITDSYSPSLSSTYYLSGGSWTTGLTYTLTGVSNVTTTNDVMISPKTYSDALLYASAGVFCTGQTAETLYFICSTKPATGTTIGLNIKIF